MSSPSPARAIALTGIFTALCVILQSAPVFLPGIGMLLSPFSTLPILITAMLSTACGVFTLFCGSAILLFISPQEAAIFMFATGLLGLVMGASIHRSTGAAVLLSAGALFIGINALMHIVGIAAFGSLTAGYPLYFTSFLILLFSFCYCLVWVVLVKRFMKRLVRAAQIQRGINDRQR